MLDASVAIPWFVSEGKPYEAEAERVGQSLRSGMDHAIVPEQFFFEVLAAFCRKLPSPDDVSFALEELSTLIRFRFPMDRELARDASRLAIQYRLSGYDAAYVALARSTGGVWVTADRQAHERIAHLGLSRLV